MQTFFLCKGAAVILAEGEKISLVTRKKNYTPLCMHEKNQPPLDCIKRIQLPLSTT